MDFPRFVYRSPGPVRYSNGACYKYVVVSSDEEMKAHLSAGWFSTEAEAIEEAGDIAFLHGLSRSRAARMRKVLAKKPKPAPKPEPEIAAEEDDDSPPTRAEMEEMATKLGVRFDGRTGDALLAKRIENKMRENGDL
jgi:hypothetical protein